MNANLKDLIAALPQEAEDAIQAPEIAQQQLQAIFADLARRPVPTGSFHRLWTMGELSTQIAMAYLAFWIRQWFSDAGRRRQQLLETNLRVALKLIHRLGYLRGAATKLGQMLGNLPEIFPNQIVETLDHLHFEAPPMHISLLRELVRDELGQAPEDLFDDFEKEPFAAASIGQVHRARLKSGEPVAIKIQYPGIARAIDSDLRNVGALLFPARLGKDWDYVKRQFEEVRRMLKLEVDYEHEAESMRQVRPLFRDEEGIVVPRVYDKYSTPRVLTTEYLSGLHLQAFLATDPSQTDRNNFGTKIYSAWGRIYRAHMNYADPHSGNYLFMRGGRLGLLDFGCVQHYTKDELEILKMSERLIEEPEILPAVLRRAGLSEKQIANEECLKLMRQSCDWLMEPLFTDGPFDFSDERHFKRGVEILSQITLKRYTRSHPLFIYWNRSLLGIRSLMYQLRAQVDVRAVFGRK
jgi:predicted unusual protein kinase regulating ubiquinone biosynthesis (AarF/ABC1/UbiB family)